MTRNSLRHIQNAFRASASSLASTQVEPPSARTVRAWLVLHPILSERRWLDAAESVLANIQSTDVPEHELADWVLVSCQAWVLHASGPSRRVAEWMVKRLPATTQSIPARLAYWRISGDRAAYESALAALPDTKPASLSSCAEPFVAAAALWSAHQATAQPELAEAARALFSASQPEQVPLDLWPLAADALDWDPESVASTVACWEDAPPDPELVIPAAAALALPTLELWIDWWIERELQEGIVAEAATYPYPGLRLRFRKLPDRDQVRFTPILDGEQRETLHDAAIVSAHLDQVLEEVDFSPLRGTPRRGISRRGRR